MIFCRGSDIIMFAVSVDFVDRTRSSIDKQAKKEVCKMAKCSYCGKGVTFGIQVSHSHRRSNRTWKPNVKRVKAVVDGTPTHVYVCSRCLRSGKVTRA